MLMREIGDLFNGPCLKAVNAVLHPAQGDDGRLDLCTLYVAHPINRASLQVVNAVLYPVKGDSGCRNFHVLLERVGHLGRTWRTTDSAEPGYAFSGALRATLQQRGVPPLSSLTVVPSHVTFVIASSVL